MCSRPLTIIMACALVLLVLVSAQGEPQYCPATGHYYEAVLHLHKPGGGLTWDQVKAEAESRTFRGISGHLATITSKDENDFIAKMVNALGLNTGFFIGGYQPAGSPEPGAGWSWVTGEPWGYENWSPKEPSNGGGKENVIQFVGSDIEGLLGRWNDIRSQTAADRAWSNYVVEYPVRQVIVATQPLGAAKSDAPSAQPAAGSTANPGPSSTTEEVPDLLTLISKIPSKIMPPGQKATPLQQQVAQDWAEEELIGKVIRVDIKVIEVYDKRTSTLDGNSLPVGINGRKGYIKVYARFTEAERKTLLGVKSGETVTVRGKVCVFVGRTYHKDDNIFNRTLGWKERIYIPYWNEKEYTFAFLLDDCVLYNPKDAGGKKPATSQTPGSGISKKPEQEAATQLNLANAFLRNGLKDKARSVFQAIIKDFPNTPEAEAAQKELQKIREETVPSVEPSQDKPMPKKEEEGEKGAAPK